MRQTKHNENTSDLFSSEELEASLQIFANEAAGLLE